MAGPGAARRGRPPKAEAGATRDRLLDAAAAACAERGFDGATLQEVARRAGVTATAVYTHYDSREELLHEAGVRGLQRMTDTIRGEGGGADVADIALAYLRPDMADTRRLLAELHLAGRRDARLAALLDDWHRTEAARLAERLGGAGGEPAVPEASVKALFLLLLGLCHLDDLAAVESDPDALATRVTALARATLA
jgi:AcrR family transcriptional regulator